MKYIRLLLLYLLIAGIASPAKAQLSGRKTTLLRRLEKVVWTVGLSGVVIDDDGRPFKQLFNVNKTWSSLWIPSKLDFEGALINGWSANVAVTFSQLKAGKLVADNLKRQYTQNLVAVDIAAKYDLNEVIGDTKAFSPYAISGFGYTYRDLPAPKQKNGIMFDFGLGFNIWIYKGFGFNAQSMAKFALNRGANGASNYLQHTIGVVYRFNVITGYRTPGRLGHRYNLFRN